MTICVYAMLIPFFSFIAHADVKMLSNKRMGTKHQIYNKHNRNAQQRFLRRWKVEKRLQFTWNVDINYAIFSLSLTLYRSIFCQMRNYNQHLHIKIDLNATTTK